MAKAISLHIGLNRVDSDHYGSEHELLGPENDAALMEKIADFHGYDHSHLLGPDATSKEVTRAIERAADALDGDGIYLLTFAGHGSQIRGAGDDEITDETWALFDRFFLDDELYALWLKFRRGTRIVVVSDSCHSGTVTSLLLAHFSERKGTECDTRDADQLGFRGISLSDAADVRRRHAVDYDQIQAKVFGVHGTPLHVRVLLLAACGDGQRAKDGSNGLFTSHLDKVWDSGNFNGSYLKLWEAVQKNVVSDNPKQQPALWPIGEASEKFYKEIAFTR